MKYRIDYCDTQTWDEEAKKYAGQTIDFELPGIVSLDFVWTYACGLLFLKNWVFDTSVEICLYQWWGTHWQLMKRNP